jgi:ABC-type uncharacterized transport system substrate-binding protein
MKRRQFIVLLSSAVIARPLAVRAQQEALPLIGYLSNFPPDTNQKFAQAFLQGLNDERFVEGRNITIEYRLAARGHYDQLPMLAADLLRRKVAVLFASPINSALAAKAAATATPVVFAIGSDPVEMGLVASLSRPGGNATGATWLSVELGAKRLELLRELLPKISSIALLVNPKNPTTAIQAKDLRAATTALGLQLNIVSVGPETNFDNIIPILVRQHTDAVVVSADSLFFTHRDQLVRSAAHHSMPVMYFAREFVVAGGLISYATSYADSIRKAGTYVGRILKGEEPANLPVLEPTKFEFVLNLKTATALGLTVPPSMQVAADEVIE